MMSYLQLLFIFGSWSTTLAQFPYQGQSAYLPENNNFVYSGFNSKVYSLPSMVVPVPCQAYVLREQMNYICAHGKIWCLPGWKNPKNYCRDPDCPEGCNLDHGECNEPNVCTCKVGYYGHACQNCITLPGCMRGGCNRAFECICNEGWTGIYCNKAVCKEGCNADAGYCDLPNECRCHMGWRGENCSECSTLPGCVHGSCDHPMECNCLPGWRGALCEQPICNPNCVLPYGKCLRPNFCICEMGYSGVNCEECRTYPGCVHGTCAPSDDGSDGLKPWTCQCQEGWRGMLCNVPAVDPNDPRTQNIPPTKKGTATKSPLSMDFKLIF